MLLVSYIQQYFNTSITVLTNQVWKLLIALFKVPNTGVFTGTMFIFLLNLLPANINFDKLYHRKHEKIQWFQKSRLKSNCYHCVKISRNRWWCFDAACGAGIVYWNELPKFVFDTSEFSGQLFTNHISEMHNGGILQERHKKKTSDDSKTCSRQ